MTISEWLLIAQTLVLAATGVVVVWYTWETRLIRVETARQNQLISKQLEIVLQKELRDQREALVKAQPVFTSWGGAFTAGTAKLRVRNDGAPASDLKIRPLGPFTATISPAFAMSGQEVQVRLEGLPDQAHEQDLGFVLSYTDTLGVPREKTITRRGKPMRFTEEGPGLESE